MFFRQSYWDQVGDVAALLGIDQDVVNHRKVGRLLDFVMIMGVGLLVSFVLSWG